ncbi:MAG TPA: enoyl-CoA hydratase/isomerase family protein [Acidimicrobiia bacterium]|jgi:enoyl-CoA hydratase/carnithine racemase
MPVELRVEHDVCVLHLGDGENLVDRDFLAAVDAALDRAASDHAGQPLVTTAEGKFFSNGFDLTLLTGLRGAELGEFIAAACGMLGRVMTFPAPTVAAVNGHAFGVAAMLALAHDQRVMREDRGWWCLPEIDLGMVFHPFMQELITAKLAPATVHEAMLSGKRYDGPDALAAGIVDDLAAELDLVARAATRATARSGKDPKVLGSIKRSLHAGVLAKRDARLG